MSGHESDSNGQETVSRREFLKLAGITGASVCALGGLGGLLAACGEETTTTTGAPSGTTASTTPGMTETTVATTVTTGAAGVGEVIIGITEAQTGALGPFTKQYMAGADMVFEEVSAAGGLQMGGGKVPLKIVRLDNKSDPKLNADNARQLFLSANACAVITAITPAIDIPAMNIAEQLEKPLALLFGPLQAIKSANKAGWKWSWFQGTDQELASQYVWNAADLVQTNKRAVIFVETSVDGQARGDLLEQFAKEMGYEPIRANFQPGLNDFSSFIKDAKDKPCDVMVGLMVGTDAISLLKQVKAMGYKPQFIDIEKAASDQKAMEELGALSSGICWCSTAGLYLGSPLLDKVKAGYKKLYNNENWESGYFETAMVGYNSAKVLLDAISRAGSTEAKAINDAMAATTGDYIFGPVKFVDNGTPYISCVVQRQGENFATQKRPMIWGPTEALMKLAEPPIIPTLGK